MPKPKKSARKRAEAAPAWTLESLKAGLAERQAARGAPRKPATPGKRPPPVKPPPVAKRLLAPGRVPLCTGCGLFDKDTPPLPLRSEQARTRVQLVFRNATEEGLYAGNHSWLNPIRHLLPPYQALPLLRCPYGAPAALKRAMGGDNQVEKRLRGCHIAHLDWSKVSTSDTVYVALGSPVFQAIQAAQNVPKDHRVKWADVWGTYVTVGSVTVYVAADWTMPNLLDDRMLQVDIERIRCRPAPEPLDPVYRVTPKEFLAALAVTRRKWGPIAADLETSGFEPQTSNLRTLGIAHPSYGAVVLATHDMEGKQLVSDKWIKRCVAALYQFPVIWHNSTFDTRWLEYLTGLLAGPLTLDTRWLHKDVYELAPHSLAVACSMEWNTDGWKDGLNHGLMVRYLSDLILYNGLDCINTWRLYSVLCKLYTVRYGRPPFADRYLIPPPKARVHGVEPPHRFGTRVVEGEF